MDGSILTRGRGLLYRALLATVVHVDFFPITAFVGL